MEIVIESDGTAHCIYSETIRLASLGRLTIKRGSHVEADAEGRWVADLSPVNGPRLGPFDQRSQALAAEVEWLAKNWLPKQAAG